MKNQYFGDRRDFFKYDLILSLIEGIDSLNSFTFIPMLTENDTSKDGNITQYNGSRRNDLQLFLRNCLNTSNRDIINLRTFMNDQNVIYYPFKDTTFFTHKDRNQYFNDLAPDILRNSVILFDPDNGFEVKSMKPGNGHKYLKYGELYNVFMETTDSIVLVYQHIPRVKRRSYFIQTVESIKRHLNIDKCLYISDNEIVFFIITKPSELLFKGWEIVKEYSSRNLYLADIL